MNFISPSFQARRLQYSPNSEAYALYKAALEWSLIDPIVIENEKDLRSRQDWKDLVDPYNHQVANLITFCRRLPVTLLSDDVGLGKTISAGLVASELMARGRVSKILVVCPKLLLPQWAEELKTKFGIESVEVVGQELLRAQIPNDCGAVITTYHSAKLYLDNLGKAGFEMLILDEAHKLRNLYGVQQAPQVAINFQKALKDRLFRYVLMLTATPIQNRLWDIYSLVDLLTVARGHKNPFGTPGMFARNFIADSRAEARQLRPEKKDEFRQIVYSYMSRTRRGDVPLLFPERQVLLHRVNPTPKEIEIFDIIKEPIQKLNRLVQISILQALVSSPHALADQLETSARNGNVAVELAIKVRSIVKEMKTTAKLEGLVALVENLRKEQGENWRIVIFTERRETQTTIEAFLGERGIICGLINGDSGAKNQETIEKFKNNPPEVHVIVSTRAGSEGVNLQAANVLVNYDLPWNPMIVEQRIGRVQRLASKYANVSIFNIILQGTFEEYIVGRLMEKLQMASHAIGDVEALLEAAGMDDEAGSRSFEEKIRELVITSLAGQDVQEATRLAEESINQAKLVLEKEEKNINNMLGGMDGAVDLGPRCPKLPSVLRSMTANDFVLKSLAFLGAQINKESENVHSIRLDGRVETIRFENDPSINENTTLCRPGSPFFDKLATRIGASSFHTVDDVDQDIHLNSEKISREWVGAFEGSFTSFRVQKVRRCFTGAAILNVRITNAHDSYERLVEVECTSQGDAKSDLSAVEPLSNFLDDPSVLGLPVEYIKGKAMEDLGVTEFCRFYLERLEEELRAAGDSFERKKKLTDDFTPHVEISLVGLEGKMYRELRVQVVYKIEDGSYENTLTIAPHLSSIIDQPAMEKCSQTGNIFPVNCLGKCDFSGKRVLLHLLKKSEISDRHALPEHMTVCALSKRKVIVDEVEISDVTGKQVCTGLLKTSALSGKKAEPDLFGICEFTSSDVLKTELHVSQVSGKKYRSDEEVHSAVSGKVGHRQEFIFCSETNKPMLFEEAEKCAVTNKVVMPGILQTCEITGKKVLPSELETSAISGKTALKQFFVSSSLSNMRLLQEEAIRSSGGEFCSSNEAELCTWDGQEYHPHDVKQCSLTALSFHYRFIDKDGYFSKLHELLNGKSNQVDSQVLWEDIADKSVKILGSGRANVINSEASKNTELLACCLEVKTWAGLKVRHAGVIYSLKNKSVVGKITNGKRESQKWIREEK